MELNIDRSNWRKVKLGDVAFEYRNRINNPSESEFDRFVGSSNIGQWDFRIKSWEPTDSVTSAMKLFEKDDYLLVRRSLYASDFRERAPRAHFAGVCSGDILTIKENPEFISNGFLIGILNSPKLWKFVVSNASGSITRRIKWKDLANYEFLLPPKEEQARLAELLWAMDEVVEKVLILRKNAIKSRLSYIHKYFAENDISMTKLFKVAEVKYGMTLNKKRNEMKLKIPYLRVANVSRGSLYLDVLKEIGCSEGEIDKFKLQTQDVLFVEGHADIKEIGRAAIWRNEREIMLHQNHLIRVRCGKRVSPIILEAFANSAFGQVYFQRHSKSSSGLNTINSSVVKNFNIPIIPKQLWEEFESTKTALDLIIKNIENRIISSKNIQKSLINQIF